MTHDPSFQRYLDDIRKEIPTQKLPEGILFRLYQQGNSIARQKVITSNLRFVVKVALEYRNCPIPLSDLISEGSVGLIHAVETFDPGRGIKFISYAVWWIRSHITRAINEKGYMIRIPSNQYLRLRKATRTQDQESLADEDIRFLQQLSMGCISLNRQTSPGESSSRADQLQDFMIPDPGLEAELAIDSQVIFQAIAGLSERQQKLLRVYFGLDEKGPRTLKEVGEILGLSAERVRQVLKKTLQEIRLGESMAPLRDRYMGLLESHYN